MESDEENRNNSIFQNNLFDKKSNNGKKNTKIGDGLHCLNRNKHHMVEKELDNSTK